MNSFEERNNKDIKCKYHKKLSNQVILDVMYCKIFLALKPILPQSDIKKANTQMC